MESAPVEIAWLEVADPPALWRDLGYLVDNDGVCVIGGIEHRLIGSKPGQRGLVRWGLRGLDRQLTSLDGLPTVAIIGGSNETEGVSLHPNQVSSIDHLVMRTSSTPRTATALEGIGLVRRGQRDSTSLGEDVDMTFFWIGRTLLEIVGPPAPKPVAKPTRFMGIAYVSADLDATANYLGDLCSQPKDAVQPGRRIAALRSAAGSTMAMAFMTPHQRSGS